MRNNRIAMALLSLVLAFALWAYVITEVDTDGEETFSGISLSLDGVGILEERELMLMPGGDESVTLRLAGRRADLNSLSSTNITVKADVSSITEPGEFTLPYNIYYPGDIPSGSITAQSRVPSMVKVTVARRISREIPVKLIFEGSVPNNFISDKENAVLDYESVRVTGPEAIIEKIDHAAIEIDLTNRTESVLESHRFKLCDAMGEPVEETELVFANVAEVQVQVKIQRLKTVPLTVTVVDGGGATSATTKIEISPVSIQVSGSETALASLEEINLGTIELEEVLKAEKQTFDIVLPDSVTNLTGVDKAVVSISFPDLATKTFQISDIAALHVPEGLEADILTEQLPVTVRGPKEKIQAMTGSDLKATVDFTNAELGTSSWKAQITITTAGVGAVGAYSVSATVQYPSTEE